MTPRERAIARAASERRHRLSVRRDVEGDWRVCDDCGVRVGREFIRGRTYVTWFTPLGWRMYDRPACVGREV